uniref:cytochrome P450 2J2-like n=1 Tax=Centroberyx gerrardi TaxID=166262 RepID=UPI003AAD754B
MLLLSALDWLDAKSALLFIVVFLLVVHFQRNRNPRNFPPGPWALPFLGNVFTGFDYHAFNKLAAQFGNIFSIRFGGEKLVIVSGYNLVKEVLVTQGDCFLDRPVSPLFDVIFKGNGISMSSGYKWRRQRQFSIAHLKYFGEGKRTLELHCQLECTFLCEAFQQEKGPFNPLHLINNAVANVIGSLVFGKRFDYDSEDFQNLLRRMQQSLMLAGTLRVQLYDICPWLFKHLPGPHEIIIDNYATLVSFLKREIEKHKRDWDPFDHRDFIDAYIGQIDKKKNDVEAGFNIDNLAISTLDLFEAGTETMTTSLRWGLVYMMKYPEIQEKVQEEIERVIGQSRQPCLADRANMPFTEAVIHETQRMGDLVPLNFPRLCTRDTTVGGYFIPQGTTLVTTLSSVLHDETEWETPHQFNPQHFLDEHGRFRKREAFFPFSAGKRMCLGEQLARMELFLFFTSLLQRFSISPPPGQEVSLENQGTFVLSPKPFHICLKAR